MQSRERLTSWGAVLAPLLIALCAWFVASTCGWVSAVILPSPALVAGALPGLWREGLYVDLAITSRRVLTAVVAAAVVGVPAGLYMGYKRRLFHYLEAPIHAMRSIPVTALFPLLVLVVGISEPAIATIAAYPSALLMLVHCASGAALANKRRVQQAEALGMSGFRLARKVLFFEALPSLLQALRSATSQSLVLVVAIEMFFGLGQRGLGRRIFDFQSTYRTPEALATILITGALGIALNAMLTLVARRALAWHPAGHDALV